MKPFEAVVIAAMSGGDRIALRMSDFIKSQAAPNPRDDDRAGLGVKPAESVPLRVSDRIWLP